MRILAMLAHPEDIESQCGGTLIKCVKRGDEVFACHLSDGNLEGSEVFSKARCDFAKKAADLCGYHLICGGFEDLNIFPDDKEARGKVVEIIKNVKPDLIITHNPKDNTADMEAASKLTRDANYIVGAVPVYFASTYRDTGFVPTEFIDITDEWEVKKKACLCYENTVPYDFTENAETSAKFYGYQCGAKYAEVFARCNTCVTVPTKRLLP